jgi:ATP-dependent Clp protease ATP-binding subunit ClpA
MESKGRGAVIGQMNLTSRASNALKMATEESQEMGHKYVGTEHLLVGLIHESEGVASKELIKRGIDLDKARSAAQTVAVEEDDRSETLTFHNIEVTVPMPEPDMNHSPVASEGEVLDLEEASQLLRIDIDSMNELLKSEGLPARLINGQWRFSRSALIRWLGEGNSRNYVE